MQYTITCHSCGGAVTLPEGRNFGFCSHCGTKLEVITQQVNTPETLQAEPENAAAQGAPAWQGNTAAQGAPAWQGNTAAQGAPAWQENTTPQGAPAWQENTYTQQPGYTAPVRKKPRFIKAVAAAVSVVAVAAVAVVGFTAFGRSSYEKAEAEFFGSLFKAVPAASDNSGKLDFALEYEPSRYIMDYAYMTDVALSGSISYQDEMAAADLTLKADGSTVSNVGLTYNGKEMTFSLPDITDYYLRWAVGGSETGYLDVSKLDTKKLQGTLSGIGKGYFKLVGDYTEVDKDVRLSSGNVTLKCDAYTIEFTESLVSEIGLMVLDELENNENLMDFIAEYIESMGGDSDELYDSLKEARNALRETRGSNMLFRMTVWVSGNEIVARKIDRVYGSDLEISYQNIVNGRDMHIEANVSANGDYFMINGDFEKSGSAWSGTINASATGGYYGDELFSLNIECFDLEKSGDQVTGEVSVSGRIDDVSCEFDITLEKSGSSQVIILEGEAESYYDRIDVGVLTITYTYKSGGKVTIPELDSNYGVGINDYSTENGKRADAMAEELYSVWDTGYYDYNEIISELIYELWYFVDDIAWYSDYYGYGETSSPF